MQAHAAAQSVATGAALPARDRRCCMGAGRLRVRAPARTWALRRGSDRDGIAAALGRGTDAGRREGAGDALRGACGRAGRAFFRSRRSRGPRSGPQRLQTCPRAAPSLCHPNGIAEGARRASQPRCSSPKPAPAPWRAQWRPACIVDPSRAAPAAHRTRRAACTRCGPAFWAAVAERRRADSICCCAVERRRGDKKRMGEIYRRRRARAATGAAAGAEAQPAVRGRATAASAPKLPRQGVVAAATSRCRRCCRRCVGCQHATAR